MGFLARSTFAKGWTPDADSVNAPIDALLRADNCVLDELGVLAVRPGSAKINGVAFADTDIHSLFTGYLSGTRYRMAGAGAAVYANGTSVASGTAGSGDIAFGSYLGNILWARSTTKKKYDGTTVRNLGISMTGGTPTIAAVAADSTVETNADSGEAGTFNNLGGATSAFVADRAGSANSATELTPGATLAVFGREKVFAADQNQSTHSGGAAISDEDVLSLWVYLTDPAYFNSLAVMIDVNGGTFRDDYYFYQWSNYEQTPVVTTPEETFIDADGNIDEYAAKRARLANDETNQTASTTPVTTFQPIVGWNKVSIARRHLLRAGSTNGKDWSTVRAVRVTFDMRDTSASSVVRYDDVRFSGGPMTGLKRWVYVYVRNDGTYTAKSAPSAVSAETYLTAQGATVTAPGDASRDNQVNEIWLFRWVVDAYYRVLQKTSVSGTGAVAMSDTATDADALITNIKLEHDNAVPPSNIISMAGPYYDRMFYLTSDGLVYPSRQRNPDSCSSAQAIRVTGVDETPYWIKKAFGGLLVGTTKDVYRIEGTGAELPDGSVDFTLAAVNIDHPPRSEAVAQEGDRLIYLASDGWRALNGAASQSLVGATSLLYRGQTRHGVSSVNLSTGRFRAAITKGQLIATTPEGASTTSTAVLYRYVFDKGWWYRHTYGSQAWRCVHREPDGTLIASDSAGFVWTLDTGTQDASTDIAIVLWTKVDDDGLPLQRKDPWDIRVRADTGNANATVAVHFDGSGSSATSFTVTQNGMGVTLQGLSGLGLARQFQLRVTGSFSTFRWYDYGIQYQARPPISTFVEPKPELPSLQRRRFGGIQIVADTLGAAATVTPILDGTAQSTLSLTTSSPLGDTLTFNAVVGRDLWAQMTKATGFEYFQLQPLVLDTLPVQQKGLTPESEFGYPGIKTMSGIQMRVCTLGAAVTVTVYVDGTAQTTTHSVTTGGDDPDEVTLAFPAAVEGARVALSFSGDVELYDWKPIVTAKRPLGVKAFDSGPLDLGVNELVWLREVRLKVRAGAQLTVTPYFDGVAWPSYTTTDVTTGVDTLVSVPIGRAYKGKIPRVVITSSAAFYAYWIAFTRRTTGAKKDTPEIRVPLMFGGEVAA